MTRTNPPKPAAGIDAQVERLGRWTAKRTTRRSFLHRLSQVAVMVAAGPAVANLLIREAQARVCGQSGITPKCETFECVGEGSVWGWCWYASDGCCSDGGLKKICDCCILDYPNVHGYCPAGTNVACIVESCGNDPRVLSVDLVPVEWDAAEGYFPAAAVAATNETKITSPTKVVIVPDRDPYFAYLGAPLAGSLGIPLFASSEQGLGPKAALVIEQLAPTEALIIGDISPATSQQLSTLGMIERTVASGTDLSLISREIAGFMQKISSVNRTVTLASTGLSADAAALAAVFASVAGFPLMLNSDDTTTVGLPTLYIGPEPLEAGVPSERTTATNMADLSIELAELASSLTYTDAGRLAVVPEGSFDVIGMVNAGAPVVLHPQTSLGPIEDWLDNHILRYGTINQIFYVKGPGELSIDQYWSLQGAANGFRTSKLTGVSGQGLPVIRQPYAERPIGLARLGPAPQPGSTPTPDYWTSVGQTFRR